MKAIITLGCEGRVDNGFVFCSGVNNKVVDLDGLEASENYLGLVEYLDEVVKIFDTGACCNANLITNAIYKIYDWGYVSEERYMRFCDFYKFHGRCGLILGARLKDGSENNKKLED